MSFAVCGFIQLHILLSVIFKQFLFFFFWDILFCPLYLLVFLSPSCFAHLFATCLAHICVLGMGVFLQERISLITLTMALMKTRGRHIAKNRRGCEWDSRSLQSVQWPARSLWEQFLQFNINVVFFLITTESNCLHTDWHLKLTYPKIDLLFE